MSYDSLMVFTGTAHPKLAQDAVKHLNIHLGRATVGRFSDGEIMVEILENVRGKDVFVLQSTCAPTNDSLMEILYLRWTRFLHASECTSERNATRNMLLCSGKNLSY